MNSRHSCNRERWHAAGEFPMELPAGKMRALPALAHHFRVSYLSPCVIWSKPK